MINECDAIYLNDNLVMEKELFLSEVNAKASYVKFKDLTNSPESSKETRETYFLVLEERFEEVVFT